MTIRERRVLRGDRNQCAGCGEFFNSTFAFDKHRIGSHGVHEGSERRRCMSPAEMLESGMLKNRDDFWVGNPWQEYPVRPSSEAQTAANEG